VILDPPRSQAAHPGAEVSFAVKAVGEPPLFYRWHKDGVPLVDGGKVSGADTAMIRLGDVQTSDEGRYSVTVSNPLGSVTSPDAVLSVTPALPLAEALDTLGWTWSTAGNLGWAGQSDVSHDGVDAAQSGTITHGQQSWIETTLNGPGMLSYWWRVSSEASFDFLELHLNGVLQSGRISGEMNWQQRTLVLSGGPQKLRWRYLKDGTGSSGQDCGWVDQVAFGPGSPPEVLAQPQSRAVVEGRHPAEQRGLNLGCRRRRACVDRRSNQ